jgi:four helix bundle protein
MHRFKDLLIWQKGRNVTKRIYEVTNSFPKDEQFGITSQMRRAAISIISNIAEGCGRKSNAYLRTFLTYSLGSAAELESQCIIANDLNYLSGGDFDEINKELIEIQKMTVIFIEKLK